jgi:lipopolysaccharide/colanic/teichoic acid biosynthesis glycosyltransferase
MKRAFDIVGSVLGLLLFSPLLVTISVMIAIYDGHPVLFRQRRVGHRGAPFEMLKFRTMVRNAEALGKQLTVGNDARITPIGRWLRKFKLDELPQLLNVLTGEMSLVGPRPEVPRYVACYNDVQRRVLELKPGITDPASISFRDESELLESLADPERAYVETIMPEKIRLNLEYAERANVLRDFGVILQTLVAIGRPATTFALPQQVQRAAA